MNNQDFFLLLKKQLPIDIINIILAFFGKKGVGGNYIEKIDLPKICQATKVSSYVDLKHYILSTSVYKRDDYICYFLKNNNSGNNWIMYSTDNGWHNLKNWDDWDD